MRRFLILKLQGPMQAWGGHTFEDVRPSLAFPTRSALLGLLGACLGVRREDPAGQQDLSQSLRFAVRVDGRFSWLTDYHTVLNARQVGGKVRPHPVVSRREYLVPTESDAGFTVAVWEVENAKVRLPDVVTALGQPVFTPSLGRRSCPLARPLYEAEVEAANAVAALAQVLPSGGPIYSEEGNPELPQLRLRDEPIIARSRQFASRRVYVHNQMPEGGDVSQQN